MGSDFDFQESLIEKWEAMPAQDALIFTLGGILGYHGWTPLTSLIGLIQRGSISGQAPQFNIVDAGLFAVAGPALFLSPVYWVGKLIFGIGQAPANAPPSTQEEIMNRILKASLGAIEAYALTRPGAIGGILQGIGEIIPL